MPFLAKTARAGCWTSDWGSGSTPLTCHNGGEKGSQRISRPRMCTSFPVRGVKAPAPSVCYPDQSPWSPRGSSLYRTTMALETDGMDPFAQDLGSLLATPCCGGREGSPMPEWVCAESSENGVVGPWSVNHELNLSPIRTGRASHWRRGGVCNSVIDESIEKSSFYVPGTYPKHSSPGFGICRTTCL